MRRTVTPCVLVLFTLRLAGWAAAQAPAPAQERGARTPEAKSDEKCDAAAMKEESAATEHSIRVGGQTTSYKATAATTLLRSDKDQSSRLTFFIAYTTTTV